MLLRALPLIAAIAFGPTPPTASAVPTVDAYRGLGTWVSIYSKSTLDDPAGAVARMKAQGVQTLYLETSNWRQSTDIVRPGTLAAMIEAAHAQGIKVVAWYLPSYKPVRTDLRRSLNAIGFTTPTAQRFDGFALDIEATEVGSIPRRNRLQGRLAANLRRSVGPDYPLGAIVPEAGALYWPGFPYAQTARYFDVFLPMAYFTFRVHGAGAVRGYVGRNISTIKSIVGADTPVHPIGGEADRATASEVAAYVPRRPRRRRDRREPLRLQRDHAGGVVAARPLPRRELGRGHGDDVGQPEVEPGPALARVLAGHEQAAAQARDDEAGAARQRDQRVGHAPQLGRVPPAAGRRPSAVVRAHDARLAVAPPWATDGPVLTATYQRSGSSRSTAVAQA